MEEEKIVLELLLEPLCGGPLTFENFLRGTEDGIKVIDNDELLYSLNDEIGDLFDEPYEFNSHNKACYYNNETFIKNFPLLKEKAAKFLERINEINDGSFILDDKRFKNHLIELEDEYNKLIKKS